MSRKLLQMVLGITAAMDYGFTDLYGAPSLTLAIPKGTIPSDKQKCQPKQQHKFIINGIEIMAASRKDAIKKFNHLKGK